MKEFSIQSPCDSLNIACMVEEPEAQPFKGIVQLVHGMCEHKERYVPFMEFLAHNGFVSVIHDHRGHGASVLNEEDLGYFGKDGWLAMVKDTKAVSDWAKANYPGVKLHLFGHSMGSMVVRSYAKRFDDSIASLTVCGCPSDNPAKGIGKLLSRLFICFRGSHYRPLLLQKISFGSFNKPFADEGYHNAWVCSDKEILEQYHKDPLCRFVFTADGFYNLLSLMGDCYSSKGWQVKNPTLPIHFISGAQDPCRVSDKALENAVEMIKKAGYANTDLKTFDGMRHEILNETDKQTVWAYVLHTIA